MEHRVMYGISLASELLSKHAETCIGCPDSVQPIYQLYNMTDASSTTCQGVRLHSGDLSWPVLAGWLVCLQQEAVELASRTNAASDVRRYACLLDPTGTLCRVTSADALF